MLVSKVFEKFIQWISWGLFRFPCRSNSNKRNHLGSVDFVMSDYHAREKLAYEVNISLADAVAPNAHPGKDIAKNGSVQAGQRGLENGRVVHSPPKVLQDHAVSGLHPHQVPKNPVQDVPISFVPPPEGVEEGCHTGGHLHAQFLAGSIDLM